MESWLRSWSVSSTCYPTALTRLQQPAGAKGVQVGSRIAILAEEGDSLENIDVSADETPTARKEDAKVVDAQSSSSALDRSQTSASNGKSEPGTDSQSKRHQMEAATAHAQQTVYLPSVLQLLHENGIRLSKAGEIPATGPRGRLLKGDVLAFLGSIEKSYPAEQSRKIEALSRLDLDNIKIASPKSVSAPSKSPTVSSSEVTDQSDVDTQRDIAVVISLKAVAEVRSRIHDAVGINIPLSTFIDRAISVCNTELPRPASARETSQDLFDQVLGLKHSGKHVASGIFVPEIGSLFHRASSADRSSFKHADILDQLTMAPGKRRVQTFTQRRSSSSAEEDQRVFTLSVTGKEEPRAEIFLGRLKTVLQADPGSLVM